MNPYGIPSVIAFFFTLLLGIFVYLRNPKNIVNVSFFRWLLALTVWHLGSAMTYFAQSNSDGLFASRLTHTGAIFIPATFLHFILSVLRLDGLTKKLIVSCYVITLLLEAANITPLFIKDVSHLSYNYYGVPGIVYPLFALFFFSIVVYCHFCLFRSLLKARGRRREQLKYLFIASVIGYSGGAIDFLPIFNIDVYAVGNPVNIIFVSLVTYAILVHQLMEIEIIIKKTLVFAGLFGFVVATVSLVVYFLNTYLARYTGLNPTLSTGIAIVIAMFLYDPVKHFLIEATDRYLFQKKEDFRKILQRLSENVITILDLDQVAKTILATFRETLRADSGTLLLKNETDYRVLNFFGLLGKEGEGVYRGDDPLILYFRTHPEVIDLEVEETSGRLPRPVSSGLEKLGAVVAIPLILQRELIGLLTLGKKRSDQEYSQEEMDYFPVVAGQVAIALNNAQLYHQSIEDRKKIETMQLELIHREKMAFVSDLVKGIAHEVFNPLTPVFHSIDELEEDVFVDLVKFLKEDEGRIEPALFEKRVQALDDFRTIIGILKRNTAHIHLVIDTLNKMQKEDRETIGPLDFKMFLKDSKALIGMEIHEGGREIPIEEDVPRGMPPIKGNPTLLAQVFVNLFKNAIYAMEGKTEKKIRIQARLDPEDNQFVKVDFSDMGSGIPTDVLPKIFDFGFTTKGKQGQGIGLNQCRLIIEKFGGSIACTSRIGVGTTFTIRLPIYKEDPLENSNR